MYFENNFRRVNDAVNDRHYPEDNAYKRRHSVYYRLPYHVITLADAWQRNLEVAMIGGGKAGGLFLKANTTTNQSELEPGLLQQIARYALYQEKPATSPSRPSRKFRASPYD